MEQITSLYKIMLLLSAVVMLMGFFLNLGKKDKKDSCFKMLLIMAFVNIISIADYLLNLKPATSSEWSIAFVFLNSIILILNLIIAHYVFQSRQDETIKYEKQIINLFVITFISDCLFIFLVYFFNSENAFYDATNEGFFYIIGFVSVLAIWGTILPAYKAFRSITKKGAKDSRLYFLLILNMLNNLIGLYFYTLKFPSKEISIVLNMVTNLSFAYYFGYYLLSEYFRFKKQNNGAEIKRPEANYSWMELKDHLSHWNEARSYLMRSYPEIVCEVEQYQLSDLEKIHLILKLLNIKAKEVAAALNISIRAVEMQRYRIGKKISKDSGK